MKSAATSRRAWVYAWLGLSLLAGVPDSSAQERRDSLPSPNSTRVAGIVVKWIRGDKEANWRRVEPRVREAAKGGAHIVMTTECFLDGYAIADKSIPEADYRKLGEPIPSGDYFKRLATLAKELRIHLVAGMHEVDGDGHFNTAVWLAPDGSLLHKYRKQKLGHEIPRNTPGRESSVAKTPFGMAGVMICADRTEADIVDRFKVGGAEFLLCPSGGMFGPKSNDPIVQARSRETRLHIVFVHPAEFLVTAPDGSIARRELIGDKLLVSPEQAGGKEDSSGVFFFDLPARSAPLAPLPK